MIESRKRDASGRFVKEAPAAPPRPTVPPEECSIAEYAARRRPAPASDVLADMQGAWQAVLDEKARLEAQLDQVRQDMVHQADQARMFADMAQEAVKGYLAPAGSVSAPQADDPYARAAALTGRAMATARSLDRPPVTRKPLAEAARKPKSFGGRVAAIFRDPGK